MQPVPSGLEHWHREIWSHRDPPCQHQREAEEAEGLVRLSWGFHLSELWQGGHSFELPLSPGPVQCISLPLLSTLFYWFDIFSAHTVSHQWPFYMLWWWKMFLLVGCDSFQLAGAKLRSGDYVTFTPWDVCHWVERGCSSCLPAHSKFNVNQLVQVSHFRKLQAQILMFGGQKSETNLLLVIGYRICV